MPLNSTIIKLWGTFLVLGIILFMLQIYHISLQLKNKSYLQSTPSTLETQEKDFLKKL